ncbi:breast cancer type 1 susceptibility protein [Monodelphis domestica]|nr:breast cancer type 1 susceptibility protein [Monodelphis domestica]
MDLPTVTIEEVKNVLIGMQKILECPICLELIKEPVSTTCDHIFCRFCMLKLLSKKKGPSQCPLCKNNITKRSLRESTRFNQLVEGLLKTIRAFELDTGFQFSNTQDFSKWERRTPEPLKKEAATIQSIGYRNRSKRFKASESENSTLESSLGVQLYDLGIRKGSLRKQKKCIKNNAVYIKLGSDSSEDGVKNAICNSVKDQGLCQTSPKGTRLKSKEKAEYEFSERAIKSLQQHQSNTVDVHVINENATEGHSEESRGVSSSDLNMKPWNTDIHASSLPPEITSVLTNTVSMNIEKAELCDKSKRPGLARSQQISQDNSKEKCSAGKTSYAEVPHELNPHHLYERQELEEQPECPKYPRGNPQNCLSGTKLKSSIQKVNDWLSRSNDILVSDYSSVRIHEQNAEMASVLEIGHPDTTDGNSSISGKTDLVADSTDGAWLHMSERSCPRQAENNNIEDKIFGKTYHRKSVHTNLNYVTENLIVGAVASDCLIPPEHVKQTRLKRKRKTISDLQPEDFIKKTDTEFTHKSPEKKIHAVDQILEQEQNGQVMNTVNGHLEQKALVDGHVEEVNDALASELLPVEKESTFRTGTDSAAGSINHGGLKLNGRNAKMTKKDKLRKKSSARIVHELELIVDKNPSSSNETELQIDSYPSSEEIRKGNNSEQKQIRRSRRLQLLSEEIAMETKKAYEPDEQAEKSCVNEVFPDLKMGNIPACDTVSLTTESDQMLASCSVTEEGHEKSLEAVQSSQDQEDLAISGGEGSQGQRAKGNLEALEVPDTDWDTQDSTSLFPANTPQNSKAGPNPHRSQCGIMETPKELLDGCSSENTGSTTEDLRGLMRQGVKNASETTTEMEDSELDTQYLQNTFKRSKRQTFALGSSPRQECMKPCAISQALHQRGLHNATDCGDHEKEKLGNRESNKPVQAKSAVMNLAVVCQIERKPSDCASVSRICHIDPLHGGNDCEFIAGNNEEISQVPNQKQSVSPAGSSTSKIIYTKKLLEENLDEISPETAVGNEILAQSSLSLVSPSNSRDCVSKVADLNRFIGIGSNGEGSQAEKHKNKESELNTLPKLKLVQPQVCQQSFPQDNFSKEPEREEKEENVKLTPAISADSSPCLEQTKENTHFTQVWSETPDLLDSDGELKENTSFAESDIKEQSAVFGKNGKSSQVRKSRKNLSPLVHRNPSLSWKSRRQARKLESSEEEASSEEGELPSFQDLIFGKAASTPFQPTKNKTIAKEFSANEAKENLAFLNRNNMSVNNLQIPSGEASQDHDSSQESECSGSLFSSHSNSLEDLAGKANDKDSALVFGSSHQESSHSRTQEIQSGSEMPKASQDKEERETDLDEDHHPKDQGVDSNLVVEGSGYDSETSHPGDTSQLSFQSDILTTQQRDTMQDNLKKLQQEMAVLEAVLEQHSSQVTNNSSSQEPGLCPSMDQPDLKQTNSERGAEENVDHHKSQNVQSFSADKSRAFPSDSNSKNEEAGVEGSSFSKSQMPNRVWSPLSRSRTPWEGDSPSEESGKVTTRKEEHKRQPNEQGVLKQNLEITTEPESGVKVNLKNIKSNPHQNKDPALRNIFNLPTSTSALRSSQLQTIEATNTTAPCAPACNVRGQLKEDSASERLKKGGTGNRKISLVSSGLTPKENMLVQKFARKTHSTVSHQITEGTTHVIMKTDAEFVCERTLKYFLGIAGGKWVVSFLWVVQSFKEGKMLPECDFEVRGDVINGRNHRGPERARESQGMKIFRGLEICCYGPFTDMSTDQLEWMVQLCGASVVKKPSSLRFRVGSSPVVVVQPDAWEDDSSFQEIGLVCEAPVVTREWVLDSVACYQRQELDTYLISQTSPSLC